MLLSINGESVIFFSWHGGSGMGMGFFMWIILRSNSLKEQTHLNPVLVADSLVCTLTNVEDGLIMSSKSQLLDE